MTALRGAEVQGNVSHFIEIMWFSGLPAVAGTEDAKGQDTTDLGEAFGSGHVGRAEWV